MQNNKHILNLLVFHNSTLSQISAPEGSASTFDEADTRRVAGATADCGASDGIDVTQL